MGKGASDSSETPLCEIWIGLFFFRSLVDEVHEVVELRGYDDLGAAVALLAGLGVVVSDRIELASSGSRHALRINAELRLKHLNY